MAGECSLKVFRRVVESRTLKLALKTLLALMLLVARANAFSLLGPYEDWMQRTNFFRLDDIGGPMNLGEEYRWNVPVLTYAFDASFLDYFGSNGVAAVDRAVQILNELPPVSNMVLTNFPLEARSYNYLAQVQGLYDLKSYALFVLLEHMGLAEPTRSVFVLRRWHSEFVSHAWEIYWRDWAIPDFIAERNFDPDTLGPSHYINGTLYTGRAMNYGTDVDAVEVPVDPLANTYTAVADRIADRGAFYTSLTRDDVGGLGYLLRTNNLNLEILLPDVHGVGSNAVSSVNQAVRPGVDKITFVRPAYDSLLGRFFVLFTNQFTDKYVTNNTIVEQQVERVVQKPDFLFSSGDSIELGSPVARSSTRNWWNSASGNSSGPGLIRPPVTITFGRWTFVQTDDHFPEDEAYVENLRWASFNGSTNPPVTYPIGSTASSDLTVHLSVFVAGSACGPFTWQLPVASGEGANLQTSTNLINWVTLTTMTNQGTPVFWYHVGLGSQRFFRVVQ